MKVLRWQLYVSLTVAVLLGCYYFFYTGYNERSYDVWAHLEYIHYILLHGSLPDPYASWETHHPPLYYLIGALVHALASGLDIDPRWTLQLFSFFCYLGYMYFALSILVLSIPNRFALIVACLLFVTWPSNVMVSPRIGNDALLYFLWAGAFYFVLRALQENVARHWSTAMLFAALAILTKSNAIVILGVLGFYALKYFRRMVPSELTSIRFLASVIVMVAALAISVADNLYQSYQRSGDMVPFFSIYLDEKSLHVDNHVENYLCFDAESYFSQPFTHSRDNARGRLCFWNYLLKSSLFGDFWEESFRHPWHGSIAYVLGVLLLAACLAILVYVLCMSRENLRYYFPHLLHVTIAVAAVMAFRMLYPWAPHNNFRFIQPALISTVVLYIHAAGNVQRETYPVLYYLLYILPAVFIPTAVLFILLIGVPQH